MCFKFKIPIHPSELRLDYTLLGGQSFRWFETGHKIYQGVIGQRVWTLNQDETHLYCSVTKTKNDTLEQDEANIETESECTYPDLRKVIHDYLRLDVSLRELYKNWSIKDSNFASVSTDFTGIRVLDQEPVENVFSFICSSNNNIDRITSLVNILCREFGSLIAKVNEKEMFAFPSIESLAASGTEEKLRDLGFGYRAQFIEASAKMIMAKGGEKWLHSLKDLDYKSCHSEIIKLSGVGPKVADCICLMSMNHLNSIPVDIHVFKVAVRDYLPHLASKKSITPTVYEEIADHIRGIFGPYAGWAQSVLFTADLKKFKIVECVYESKTKKLKTEK